MKVTGIKQEGEFLDLISKERKLLDNFKRRNEFFKNTKRNE